MRENILWDSKISKEELKNILKDEKNTKFIYFASKLLTRTNNAKMVFSDYLSKILFCRNWSKIKNRMRKNKWNDRNIDFWDEVYKVVKKTIDPNELKVPKKRYPTAIPKVKKLGDILKEIRQKAGLTQNELADKAQLSQQTISSLERAYLNFSINTLVKIMKVLDYQITIKKSATDTNEDGEYTVRHEGIDTQEWILLQ